MNLEGYTFSLAETAAMVEVPVTTLANWITAGVPGIERTGRGNHRQFTAMQVSNLALLRDLLPLFGREVATRAIEAFWPWVEKHAQGDGDGNVWLVATPVKPGATWFQFYWLREGCYPQPDKPTDAYMAFNITPTLWPAMARRIEAAVRAKARNAGRDRAAALLGRHGAASQVGVAN